MQLGQMKRLGKIVVSSLFQSDDLIIHGVAGRDNDDIALFVFGPDQVQQVDAIAVRQADVQQDTIVLEKAQLLAGGFQGAAELSDIAFLYEEVVDITGKFLMIFNYQYLHDTKLGGFI